jgi:predicted transcriptional regulator
MTYTYLTTEELSSRIKYDISTIRNQLKDSVLIEGIHYIRPFGGRKILYVWEQIEKDMRKAFVSNINAMTLQ